MNLLQCKIANVSCLLGDSMAEPDPQRNFRSAYYEKVGFRGVEEKKSLEILLKDNPLGRYRTLFSIVSQV